MAPKPAWFEFTVGMVVAMAVGILAITTWAVAAPNWSPTQLWLLY
jgi:hypothetical protein